MNLDTYVFSINPLKKPSARTILQPHWVTGCALTNRPLISCPGNLVTSSLKSLWSQLINCGLPVKPTGLVPFGAWSPSGTCTSISSLSRQHGAIADEVRPPWFRRRQINPSGLLVNLADGDRLKIMRDFCALTDRVFKHVLQQWPLRDC